MIYGLLGLLVANMTLYRMGGSDTFDKLWRRIGCALVTTVMIGLWVQWHWLLILHSLILYGCLTTYLSEFQPPDDNVSTIEWFLTGIIYGAAALPLIWAGFSWFWIVVRMLALGITTCAWSSYEDNAVREELGRGSLLGLSVFLLD